MIYFKSPSGEVFAYETEAERAQYGAPELVKMTPEEEYAHLHPVMTEDLMRESEIEQDKAYLASTDWIIAKISEAQLVGQDTQQLVDQYGEQIAERESARIRIRINEWRS